MTKLKSISKRSVIILVCIVLLFGNLFIPVSAKEICEHVSGYQQRSYKPGGPDYYYCPWTIMTVYWSCCGAWIRDEDFYKQSHPGWILGGQGIRCTSCGYERFMPK